MVTTLGTGTRQKGVKMHHQLHPEEPELIDCDVCLTQIPADSSVNTPPDKAGGFRLRLEAGSIGRSADCPLSQDRERVRVRVEAFHCLAPPLTPTLSPEGERGSFNAG